MSMTTTHQSSFTTVSPPKPSRTIPVSEIFFSIEGEGILTGFPTVFVRTFGCNFTCSGFSGSDKAPVTEHVVTIKKLDDFLAPPTGCDSIYSWNKDYKSFTVKHTVSSMVREIKKLVPLKYWKTGRLKPVLSLTGGEPTLHQKFWIEFLKHPFVRSVDKILVETNGAVPLTDSFLEAVRKWVAATNGVFMWANSPKLSASGEPYESAIRPDIIAAQHSASPMQYFKFVTDGSAQSINEVKDALEDYQQALPNPIPHEAVLLMPMGASRQQQEELQKKVALICMEHGFVFCGRLHVWVFDNAVGT